MIDIDDSRIIDSRSRWSWFSFSDLDILLVSDCGFMFGLFVYNNQYQILPMNSSNRSELNQYLSFK